MRYIVGDSVKNHRLRKALLRNLLPNLRQQRAFPDQQQPRLGVLLMQRCKNFQKKAVVFLRHKTSDMSQDKMLRGESQTKAFLFSFSGTICILLGQYPVFHNGISP